MTKFKVEEMVMEVTRCCNLDCMHCFRGNAQNSSMSTETINNILGSVNEISKLVLSGGEPLLAIRQLNDVADMIHSYGIKVDEIAIITNGTVLNSDIIRALEKLQMVCKKISIKVSDDKFHRIALEQSGLKNKRNAYFKVLKDLFSATYYGTPRRETVLSLVESVGRAKTLTREDMDRVNSYGDYQTYYTLTDDEMFGTEITVNFSPPYYAGNLTIKNMVNIDVNGYLIEDYSSYEEADSKNIPGCNINNVNLLEAITNNLLRINDRDKQKKLRI